MGLQGAGLDGRGQLRWVPSPPPTQLGSVRGRVSLATQEGLHGDPFPAFVIYLFLRQRVCIKKKKEDIYYCSSSPPGFSLWPLIHAHNFIHRGGGGGGGGGAERRGGERGGGAGKGGISSD